MKIFDVNYLDDLSDQAKRNARQRLHRNIHASYQDACQRLFNAIEPRSYIRPHRHAKDPRDELLIAVRGLMAFLTFDEQGSVVSVVRFGAEKHALATTAGVAIGVEVPANTWHTVLALEADSVLLEVKAGPFDPSQPKDLAPWAPEEGSSAVNIYLDKLFACVAKSRASELLASATSIRITQNHKRKQ